MPTDAGTASGAETGVDMGRATLTGRLAAGCDEVRSVLSDAARHTEWLDETLRPDLTAPVLPSQRAIAEDGACYRTELMLRDAPLARAIRMVITVRATEPGTQVVVDTSWDSTAGALAGAADELFVRPRMLAAQRLSLATLGELLRPTRRRTSLLVSLAD